MIGWSPATSTSVRAIATAVSGSLDGALMIVSERVITERRIVTAETSPPLPAGMCNTREPKACIRNSIPSLSVCPTQPLR